MTQSNNRTNVAVIGRRPIGISMLPTDVNPENISFSTDSNVTKYLINNVEYPTTYAPFTFKKGHRKHGSNYTPPKRRHRKK